MKLAIIIGSTRPGRVTERLARWVINEAKEDVYKRQGKDS